MNNSIALYHNSVFAMNTQLDMVCWGQEQSIFEIAFQKMVIELEEIELAISRYNPASELFQINQIGFPSCLPVSEKLMNAVLLAATYNELTNGYFDISLGTAFHKLKNGEKPEYSATGSFYKRVHLDVDNRTLQFIQPEVSLDFGGMGKGMALKAIAKIIDSHEIENAFISFGGSSILTRGTHPHGDYWPFSLADYPEQVWKLNNDCISISGSHRKVSNHSMSHIMNPLDAELVITPKTVVAQSHNPIEAEVLSTTLIAAPEKEYAKILVNFTNVSFTVLKPI